MRYFFQCSYNGTRFHGWQRQPGSILTVQAHIEDTFSTLIRRPITITGCGRTDTGVHARNYVFHVDFEKGEVENILYKSNRILSDDLVLHAYQEVPDSAHARYDAYRRVYRYYISKEKNPFAQETVYHYPMNKSMDQKRLDAFCALIMKHRQFTPFCKEGGDVKNKNCEIYACTWQEKANQWIFTIAANRFLRGMVRLIVGAGLNFSRGKLDLAEVNQALVDQSRLKLDWSVPAHGLFLEEISYPEVELRKRL